MSCAGETAVSCAGETAVSCAGEAAVRLRTRGMLVLVLLLAATAWSGGVASAAEPGPRVVVIGIGGLRWDDVGADTPVLQRLAARGAVGALSVKALPEVTCWADGWLTLGAGARAQAFGTGRDPCTDELPADLREQTRRNAASRDAARIGALHRALAGAGLGDGAVAIGGGARLAFGWAADPAVGGFDEAVLDPRLLLVDGGLLTAETRAADLRAADAALGERLERLEQLPGDPDVVVVGLSEESSLTAGDSRAHLHVAIAAGPSFPRGALVSASTRRAPYVQLIDVAPTVLALVGEPPVAQMDGEPWRVEGSAPTVAELADLDRRAQAHRASTIPFFVLLLGTQLALLLALWRRPRAAELVALTGTAAIGASYLANLVPWWRTPLPLLALLALVLAIAAPVAVLGARARGSGAPPLTPAHPAGLACLFTAAVLLLDLLTGARLQMDAVAGYSPLVAGRFAGIGNVAFGVLAASVLLATGALTRRLGVVVAVGVTAVAVDGAPPWGSDVGGVLALVPAFVLLALLLTGRRISLLRLTLAGLAGAALVTAFALADWSRRPAERTHLGRFVQDVVDGTAGTLLRRKADAVLDLLFANVLTALLPLVAAVAVYLVVRPPAPLQQAFARAPGWRGGLIATGLASAVGFAVNDSGAAVVAFALVVALPATTAVVLRARRAVEEPPSLLA